MATGLGDCLRIFSEPLSPTCRSYGVQTQRVLSTHMGKLLLQKPYFVPYRYFGPFGRVFGDGVRDSFECRGLVCGWG